jgi:hypothetical protein
MSIVHEPAGVKNGLRCRPPCRLKTTADAPSCFIKTTIKRGPYQVRIINDTMPQEFEYKPLTEPDSIRLIVLKPSLDQYARVQCNLIHTTLSSDEIGHVFSHYTALSYVWGSERKVETIWIDERPLKITASLFSALCDLRDDLRSLFLWADGICINQIDDEEKGVQVQMMGQIYAKASSTIIYLGPELPEGRENGWILSTRKGRGGRDSPDADGLISIIEKEWFTRVWVFQELVLSSNPWVQCGRDRVEWQTLYSSLETDIYLDKDYAIVSEMQRAWADYHDTRKKITMLELLQARRGLGVSDPRDMVYAHVGFAADGQHEDLVVDYSKSYIQVYTDFARYIAKKHGLAALLDLVGDGQSQLRLQNLPSPVPDWTTISPTTSFLYQHGMTSEKDTPVIWSLERNTPAIIVRCSHRIMATTSELLLGNIPVDIRQSIASKLYYIIEFDGVLYVREWYDRQMLKEAWPQVYQLWRGAVADHEILPQDPGELKFFVPSGEWRERGFEFCVYPSVSTYLILAFHTGFARKSLDGKALAKTTCGRLASVYNNMPNTILANMGGPQYACNIMLLISSQYNITSPILYCEQYIRPI